MAYGSIKAKHLYMIETDKDVIKVFADNRSQAAAIARKNGYDIMSVNMEA